MDREHKYNYYNTNKETGATLAQSRDDADTQTRQIEKFLQFKYPEPYAVHEVVDELYSDRVCRSCKLAPYTLVRGVGRAVSDIKNKGLIEELEKMITGDAGKQVHQYRWLLPMERPPKKPPVKIDKGPPAPPMGTHKQAPLF